MSEIDTSRTPRLVRDLMTVGVPTCVLDTPLQELATAMLERNWESVVVLENEHGHAVGVVSRDSLIEAYAGGEIENLTAESVMREGVPTVPPDVPLAAAARIMLDLKVRALYMTHHAGGIEYPAAWLTYTHLIRHLSGDDLADLGIKADRESPLDTFLRRRAEARKRAGLAE